MSCLRLIRGSGTFGLALLASSGDAFKCVYGKGHIHEPMRDLTPNDFIRDGLAFYGVTGRWLTG